MSRLRSRGFTLVELLVVLAIIALLIAILMPALRKAKETANAVKCQTNLRTFGQAALMFAQDNKNHLPGNDDDRGNNNPNYRDFLMGPPQGETVSNFDAPKKGTLWKYIRNKENYRCPSMEGQFNAAYAGSNDRFDYGMFKSLSGALVSKVKATSQWRRVEDNKIIGGLPTPVFTQEHHAFINGSNIEGGHSNDDAMTTIHGGGGYYVSIDGSVHHHIQWKVPNRRPGFELRADYNGKIPARRFTTQCPMNGKQKDLGRPGTQFGRWQSVPAGNTPTAW